MLAVYQLSTNALSPPARMLAARASSHAALLAAASSFLMPVMTSMVSISSVCTASVLGLARLSRAGCFGHGMDAAAWACMNDELASADGLA